MAIDWPMEDFKFTREHWYTNVLLVSAILFALVLVCSHIPNAGSRPGYPSFIPIERGDVEAREVGPEANSRGTGLRMIRTV